MVTYLAMAQSRFTQLLFNVPAGGIDVQPGWDHASALRSKQSTASPRCPISMLRGGISER